MILFIEYIIIYFTWNTSNNVAVMCLQVCRPTGVPRYGTTPAPPSWPSHAGNTSRRSRPRATRGRHQNNRWKTALLCPPPSPQQEFFFASLSEAFVSFLHVKNCFILSFAHMLGSFSGVASFIIIHEQLRHKNSRWKTASVKNRVRLMRWGASVVRHLLLPLINSFNATEAPVFHMQAIVTSIGLPLMFSLIII